MFQDVDCINTTLIIPPSKYDRASGEFSYNGLSPSETSQPYFSDQVSPSTSKSTTLSQIKALSASPYLLSTLSPSLIIDFLNILSSSSCIFNSLEPSVAVSLLDFLCLSPSLLTTAPNSTLIDTITAITVCPKTLNALPPSTVVCLLSKLRVLTPDVLRCLSPAVRNALIHSVSSPKALNSLKPTEISLLIDIYLSAECVLAESLPVDLFELLRTITSSPVQMHNIPAAQIFALLLKMSKTAPSLLYGTASNVTNALIYPIAVSIHSQSTATIVDLTTVMTSSPRLLNAIDPSILSSLLTSMSPPSTLAAIPSRTIVELLTDIALSDKALNSISPESVINLFHSINSVSPSLMCDIPPSVRSAYVLILTSVEETNALSDQMIVKLIGTLSNSPCLLADLPSQSVVRILTLMTSNCTLLNFVPPNIIVNLIFDITVLSPFTLREIPPDSIGRLFAPLNSTSALSALRPCSYTRLLSSFAFSPILMNAIPNVQIVNILTALYTSPDLLREIPRRVYVNILAQIFTTRELLSNIPLGLIIKLLRVTIDDLPPDTTCAVPPSAIFAFMDYLANEPSALVSLPSVEIVNFTYVLANFSCFFNQMPVKTLICLLNLITTSPTVSNTMPAEIQIKLIHSLYSLSPSIFCSLPPESVRVMANSLNSFGVLRNLNPNNLIELTTVVSTCPCMLSALNNEKIANLLEVLSASPVTLIALEPSAVISLLTSMLSSAALTPSVPIDTSIRFLHALSGAAPGTFRVLPSSVIAILLEPLKSSKIVNNLTSTDVENLIDVLIVAPSLLGELPRAVLINLMTAIPKDFTNLPHTKIITLLNSTHSIAPSLLCTIPDDVLANLLNMFGSRLDLTDLPPKYVITYTTVLSLSPCLLNVMADATLNSFLSFLSSSPRILKTVPTKVLVNFFIKLSLTPSKNIQLPLLISLLRTVMSNSAVCLPPMVVHKLMIPLSDVKNIHELNPVDVASLISVASSTSCVFDAISGTTLDTFLSKMASSPDSLFHTTTDELVSFFELMTSCQLATSSVRPLTLVNLFTTIALTRPSMISSLPPTATTVILNKFSSQPVFASLPSPVINNFISLLLRFPNLFATLPLATLKSLFNFLSSSPVVLGTLSSRTLLKFLAKLSSTPSLLKSLSSDTLTSFYATLSTVSPKFLCTLPHPAIVALIEAVTSDFALLSLTSTSTNSLITTFNKSPYLIAVLPMSIMVTLLTHLSTHPHLIENTPQNELRNLIDNVQSPKSIPRVAPLDPLSETNNYYDFLSPQSPEISTANSNTLGLIKKLIPLVDDKESTISYVFKNDEYTPFSNETTAKTATDLIPKLILPDNSKRAAIFIFPKNHSVSNDKIST